MIDTPQDGLTLTQTSLTDGVWHGQLGGVAPGAERPVLEVLLNGQTLPAPEVGRPDHMGFCPVRVTVPVTALSSGISVFLIREPGAPLALAQFSIIAGDVAEGDVRTQLAQLRAEIDLLKRVLRQASDPAQLG